MREWKKWEVLYKPQFKIEPTDGKGTSLANQWYRNEQGICGTQDCGNPIDDESEDFCGSVRCAKCAASFHKVIEDLRIRIDEDILRRLNYG